jgi:hypothetical protein
MRWYCWTASISCGLSKTTGHDWEVEHQGKLEEVAEAMTVDRLSDLCSVSKYSLCVYIYFAGESPTMK